MFIADEHDAIYAAEHSGMMVNQCNSIYKRTIMKITEYPVELWSGN